VRYIYKRHRVQTVSFKYISSLRVNGGGLSRTIKLIVVIKELTFSLLSTLIGTPPPPPPLVFLRPSGAGSFGSMSATDDVAEEAAVGRMRLGGGKRNKNKNYV